MATSTIIITPVTNIKDYAVVDNSLVEKRDYHSIMSIFTFYNIVSQSERTSNLMDVSVYDDEIVEKGIHYKILRMLTK